MLNLKQNSDKLYHIGNYQAVIPSFWNGGPRDDNGKPGLFEQNPEGIKVKETGKPFEMVRIVRSFFDPCPDCAIHVVDAKSMKMGKFVVSR